MSNDTLYQISQDYRTVIDGGIVFDEETGEVYFDSSDIDALAVSMASKVEAVSMYSNGRRALAKARREAAKAMMASAKALDAAADRLDEYALRCVKEVGTIETPTMTVSVRKCPPSVEIVDESIIPAEYMRTKVTESVDKTAIKKAIQGGAYVPGAALVSNEKLRIR